uniref:Uncharacterized protein n=1 Tax=Neogobius melanostomus TaxID=47308 RepID=A0A8C6UQD5_9GOBI
STMAEPCSLGDALAEEEKEFQKVLAQIGGREKIHLVSDVGKSKEDDDAGILQDFLRDVFGQTSFPNGQPDSALPDTHSPSQMEMPLTVRPKAVANPRNLLYLKEILRDVKARTKRAKVAQPALIGLIRTTLESAETEQCALVLENMMRSVFHRQAAYQFVCTHYYLTKTSLHLQQRVSSKTLQTKAAFIKWGLLINWQRGKHVLIVSFKDNTRHRRNSILWPFQCLFGTNGRTPRNQANSSSSGHRQTGRSISTGPKGTHLLNRSFLTGLHQASKSIYPYSGKT